MQTQDAVERALKSSEGTRKVDALFETVNNNYTELASDVLNLMGAERNTNIKGRCAWALGRLNYKDSYPYLVEQLRHPSAQVRAWSAWALGEMRLERAAKHLQRAIEIEGEDDVAKAIGGAIKKLFGQPVRTHKSQIRKEIDAIKLPYIEDRLIGTLVHRLEGLRWPRDQGEILEIQAKIKMRDLKYFTALMKWAFRRPLLWKALGDDDIVFS